MDLTRIVKGILRIAGLKIWIASLIPMFVATTLAYIKTNTLDYRWWILSMIGIMLIETGKHCFNDLVDYKSGVDLSIDPDHVTPFSGGKKVLTEHLLTPKEAKLIGILTLSIASAIGIYIAVFHEPMIWIIGIAGVFIACAYSIRPFSFCYRGLGELAVGITYGPLLVLGTYVVLVGQLDLLPLLLSIPLGFLIVNVLWINQYPDYEADKKNNKRNWLVRIGKEKGLTVYLILFILTYLTFLFMILFTGNYFWAINCITIPMAYGSYRIAVKHHNNIPMLVKANQMTVHIYGLTGLTIVASLVLTEFVIQ